MVPFGKYKLSLDHLSKRGLNFDLGGKTPLGRKDKPHLKNPYELIQPVSGMVYYLHNEEDKMEHMDKLLRYILESTCYVYGDSSLHERYVAAKRAFLLESKDSSGRPEYQARSLKKLLEGVVEMDYSNPAQSKPGRPLVGELEDFEPKFGVEDAGKLYDVKQEIYRLPDRLLYRLAMYYGILPTSGWDAVAQLAQQGIIGAGENAQQASHHLYYAVSFATMLRLSTYLYHGQQKEVVTMLGDVRQEAKVRQAAQTAFTLPASSLQAGGSLFKYYYTAMPLHGKMKEYFEAASQERSFFQEAPFYDSSAETRAAIYQRLLQHQEEKNCYEEALTTKEQRYGPNHPDIASTLHNLGNVWSDLGDARKALSNYERALGIREEVCKEKPNHPDIAKTLVGLGNAWRDLGDSLKAVSYYERALDIYEQVYQEEPNHRYIAITLSNLGNAWRDLGDKRHAVHHLERSLDIYKQVYKEDPNHPDLAHALNSLGIAWRDLGDVRKAVSYYERALGIFEQVYGSNHPYTAMALNNLGSTWGPSGDSRKAVSYYERALGIFEQVYGSNHPYTAMALNNLGGRWCAFGDSRPAVTYCERALGIYKQVYKEDPNHPNIANALGRLGEAWNALGDAHKAVSYLERALNIYEQVYQEAPNHPDIAMTLVVLGHSSSALKDAREAVSYYERALGIYKQVYKEDANHPDIAKVLSNLGGAWNALGDARQAMFCLEPSLDILEQVYGPNHPAYS